MRKFYIFLIVFILVIFSIFSLSFAENSDQNSKNLIIKIKQISEQLKKYRAGQHYREDEMIIKFRANYQRQLNALSLNEGLERVTQRLRAMDLNIEKIKRLGPDSEFYLIKLDRNFHTIQDAMQRVLMDSEIEFAEPNYIRKLNKSILNDFYVNIPNDFYNYDLWGLTKIKAPESWYINTGSDSIVVAVVDTGVDYTHEDLSQNIWINTGEIPDNGIDDDGNGYVDDVYGIAPGYNGFTGGISISDPMDTQGHGTHVAGIIGARGNNSRGLVGVNWNIKILPCMAADPIEGTLWESNILECFAYIGNLKSRGVNIKAVNASYGGEYAYAEELSIQSNLRNKGILLITSAGNESKNNDSYPQYPCNYNLDNIICVASTDRNDNLSVYSNYGNSVHVAAPGQAIYSTYPLTADNFDDFSWNQIFYDNFESGTANWDSSHPSISGLSTNHYRSPNHSITDSVSGNYPSNSEIFIGSRNIDLNPYRTYKVWSKVYAKPFLVGEDIAAISFTLGSFERFYTPLASKGDTMIDEGYYGNWNSLYLYVPSQLRKSNFGINFILVSDEDTLTDDGVYWDDVGVYYSSSQTNFYVTMSGTSMAAPFTTGLAALIWSKEPSLGYLEVKNRILSTVDVLPQLSGKVATSGRINAYKALGGSACTPPFPDVPCDYWAVSNIQWIKDRGITTGYPDGTYRPEASVKRSEMAAFIIRALEGESFSYPSTPYFTDVTPGMWCFKYVQRLRQRGLTTGCNSEGTMYCPEGTVTRAQMAAFLVRAKVGESFSYSTTPYFSDVPSTHWAFRYIQKLRELDITTGYGDGTYGPEDTVTRAQMATFLYRAFGR